MSVEIPKTVADALSMWDAGQDVPVIEMGGMGRGYEMAIFGLAFELVRHLSTKNVPPVGVELTDEQAKALHSDADAIVTLVNKEPWAGFSGAQVGAAKNFAFCVVCQGYFEACNQPCVSDRIITVNRTELAGIPHS